MARSKTLAILNNNMTNAWHDNMIGYNSVVSEWKETSLSQPTAGRFWPDIRESKKEILDFCQFGALL